MFLHNIDFLQEASVPLNEEFYSRKPNAFFSRTYFSRRSILTSNEKVGTFSNNQTFRVVSSCFQFGVRIEIGNSPQRSPFELIASILSS